MGVTIDNMTLSGNNLRGTEFLWLETEQTTRLPDTMFDIFPLFFCLIVLPGSVCADEGS